MTANCIKSPNIEDQKIINKALEKYSLVEIGNIEL